MREHSKVSAYIKLCSQRAKTNAKRLWFEIVSHPFPRVRSIHTELLATALESAMQTWVENFAKEWVEYLFLAIPANANAQCERTPRGRFYWGLNEFASRWVH